MEIDSRPVRSLYVHADAVIDHAAWPATIPAVARVLSEGLEIGPGVTFLVGENGSGKSTLIEGIAEAFGFSPEGGSTHARHRTHITESELGSWLGVRRGAGASRWGYFLRAETMHGHFSYLEEITDGVSDLHQMSHGESFLRIFDDYLDHRGPGFYCLDEPEAALSFNSTLSLLSRLDVIREAGAQVLCATHSPVLAALPGATILQVDEAGLTPVAWEDLELVQHWRRFLDGPGRYLRHLLAED